MKKFISLAAMLCATGASTAILADEAADSLQYFHDKVTMAKLQEADKDLKSKEYDKAFALYKAMAEKGNKFGQYQLGYMYQHGFGTEKDDQVATAWYLKASQQILPAAQYALGIMYYSSGSIAQALPYLKQAALENNPEALYMLGYMFSTGTSVPQDINLGGQSYEKAAAQGMPQALYNLGYMYYTGTNVSKY
jgi:TPR repeat protein